MKGTPESGRPRVGRKKKAGRGVAIPAGAALALILVAATLLFTPAATERSPVGSLYGGDAIPAESSDGAAGDERSRAPLAETPLRVSLNSTNAILVESNDGRDVLLDVSSGERIYPASLTKIMTAVVVLEHAPDHDALVRLSQGIFDRTFAQNASTAGFLPGESVRVRDLLYGLLLSSGAECAIGLAEHIAGDETAFAALMNRKAAELGMDATHFTNATGLHDPELYTTVRDIAVLLDYALENALFYEIFTSRRHIVRATDGRSEDLRLYSTLFAKTDGEYEGFALLGGKTGYTPEAGQCLASVAEKNGRRYMLVTAGAPGDNRTEALHVEDAVAVFSAL
ncbi:MAG: D-alanyl-D-alanine carboxypeptidase [Clostridiales Family XIII bacterium]|jgi:D-alanyl-D-alanine carboxypeptidase (penicillin-binding protein 5/6)|nr:D-alanyl-D-alanine carboxypeptidase [Clostridiales Family XIII bacterium]